MLQPLKYNLSKSFNSPFKQLWVLLDKGWPCLWEREGVKEDVAVEKKDFVELLGFQGDETDKSLRGWR